MASSQSSFPTDTPAEVIVSLDADGCVFNERYQKMREEYLKQKGYSVRISPVGGIVRNSEGEILDSALLLTQQEEMDILVKTNPDLIPFLESIKINKLMCGSSRQDAIFDNALSVQNISSRFLQILPAMAQFLAQAFKKDICHDDFLLSKLQPKTGIKIPFDKSKFFLLYIQMQRAAIHKTQSNVHFYFIDDHEMKILAPLASFFGKHTDLIPEHLTLCFISYNGKLKPYSKIVGTGKVDYHYTDNVMKFCDMFSKEFGDKKLKNPNGEDVLFFLGCREGKRVMNDFKKHLETHRGTAAMLPPAIISSSAACFFKRADIVRVDIIPASSNDKEKLVEVKFSPFP